MNSPWPSLSIDIRFGAKLDIDLHDVIPPEGIFGDQTDLAESAGFGFKVQFPRLNRHLPYSDTFQLSKDLYDSGKLSGIS